MTKRSQRIQHLPGPAYKTKTKRKKHEGARTKEERSNLHSNQPDENVIPGPRLQAKQEKEGKKWRKRRSEENDSFHNVREQKTNTRSPRLGKSRTRHMKPPEEKQG